MIPPREVPEGLTAREYKRLSLLYTIMGRAEEARQASSLFLQCSESGENLDESEESRASNGEAASSQSDQPAGSTASVSEQDGSPSTDSSTSESGESDPDGSDQFLAGARIGAMLSELLKKAAERGVGEEGDNIETSGILDEMKDQLKKLGADEEAIDKIVKSLREAMTKEDSLPPRDVPQGLSAHEYYDLGVHYKSCGWTEQARDALNYAMEKDSEGEVAGKALRFLKSKLPACPVPLMAEQRNIEGFNLMFRGEDDRAMATFQELIGDYPDFEWPYGNLGSLYLKRGELVDAEKTLMKAVTINPYYVNAWMHLSRAYAVQGDFKAAYGCLERVEQIDPDESLLGHYKTMFKQLQQ